MKTNTRLIYLLFLFSSLNINAQITLPQFSINADRLAFWKSRINHTEVDKSILYEFQNGQDSLWLKEDFFIQQPKIDFNENQVWYDEVYLPVYTSWKYFEVLGGHSKGGYLGTFNFIQRENYSYKTTPSPFEFEAGKADLNLKFNEKLKNEIVDKSFSSDYLIIGHPELADKNVISPNSNYKGLSGLGTAALSGVFLLESQSVVGGRAGYKWILAERWMIEPSINYVIEWDPSFFPFLNVEIPFYVFELASAYTPGQIFLNLRFGVCLF